MVDIQSIKSSCSSPLALREDGTVLMWPGVYDNQHEFLMEILSGEKPAPWNIIDPL